MIIKLDSNEVAAVGGGGGILYTSRKIFKEGIHRPIKQANNVVKPIVENGVVRDIGKVINIVGALNRMVDAVKEA